MYLFYTIDHIILPFCNSRANAIFKCVFVFILLVYPCLARRERIRKSRRSRGRFGSETPGPVEVKVIPAEFESPKKALVEADTNSGVYTGPPCTEDAPPPYPQEPPPSYHQSVDASTSPSSDQSGDPVDHGESN